MVLVIDIPEGAKCLLKTNQFVDFNTPFIERKTKVEKDIALAQKMGIEPGKIFRYLKKFVGDNVTKGEVLALKKSVFSSQKIVCDYDGIIKEIDHSEGKIILISYDGEKNTLPAFFKGEVLEVKKNGVTLKVKEGFTAEIEKTSEDFGGEVFYFRDDDLTSPKLANRILVTEEVSPYLLAKTEALGIRGLVVLVKPQDEPSIPFAKIKQAGDLKKIREFKYPYCLITKKNSKIYFYQ